MKKFISDFLMAKCLPTDMILKPLLLLGFRLWVAWVFFKSGLTKIQSWDSTLFLFENEYAVPLLSPDVAAYLGTAAELSLPVLLAIGLTTRLSALALFVFNIVAVYAYASFLFDEGAAGLQQHILWGTMLAVIFVFGPGKISLDLFLSKYLKR